MSKIKEAYKSLGKKDEVDMGKPIYGFFEDYYPSFSDEWTHELQSPIDANVCNTLVYRIQYLEDLLYKYD